MNIWTAIGLLCVDPDFYRKVLGFAPEEDRGDVLNAEDIRTKLQIALNSYNFLLTRWEVAELALTLAFPGIRKGMGEIHAYWGDRCSISATPTAAYTIDGHVKEPHYGGVRKP